MYGYRKKITRNKRRLNNTLYGGSRSHARTAGAFSRLQGRKLNLVVFDEATTIETELGSLEMKKGSALYI